MNGYSWRIYTFPWVTTSVSRNHYLSKKKSQFSEYRLIIVFKRLIYLNSKIVMAFPQYEGTNHGVIYFWEGHNILFSQFPKGRYWKIHIARIWNLNRNIAHASQAGNSNVCKYSFPLCKIITIIIGSSSNSNSSRGVGLVTRSGPINSLMSLVILSLPGFPPGRHFTVKCGRLSLSIRRTFNYLILWYWATSNCAIFKFW